MKDYYTLTNRGRALRLRRLALAALADYDLELKSVRLITNMFNGIFRVDAADGRKFVIRVCRPTETEGGLPRLRSEVMWLAALRRDILTCQGAPAQVIIGAMMFRQAISVRIT